MMFDSGHTTDTHTQGKVLWEKDPFIGKIGKGKDFKERGSKEVKVCTGGSRGSAQLAGHHLVGE